MAIDHDARWMPRLPQRSGGGGGEEGGLNDVLPSSTHTGVADRSVGFVVGAVPNVWVSECASGENKRVYVTSCHRDMALIPSLVFWFP